MKLTDTTTIVASRGALSSEGSRPGLRVDRHAFRAPEPGLVPPDQFVSQRVFDEPGPIRYKALLYPPSGNATIVVVSRHTKVARAHSPSGQQRTYTTFKR